MKSQKPQPQVLLVFGILATTLAVLSKLGIFSQAQALTMKTVTPIFSPVWGQIHSINSNLSFLTQIQEIRVENELLNSKLLELESKVIDYDEIERENIELRNQLLLQETTPVAGKFAKILQFSYIPSGGYAFIESDSEIRPDDWVVWYNYVLGKIVESNDQIAKVQFFAAAKEEIPVEIIGKETLGKLYGQAGLEILVKDIQSNSNIQPGDTLKLFNPVDARIANHIVGRIKEVVGDPADSLWSLKLDLPIDIYNLSYVRVLSTHE